MVGDQFGYGNHVTQAHKVTRSVLSHKTHMGVVGVATNKPMSTKLPRGCNPEAQVIP